MKPEIKARWVAALKSDKYKQGTGQLKSEDKFCCLGVLTDLFIKEQHKSWSLLLETGKMGELCLLSDMEKYSASSHVLLPNRVMKWAGLTSYNPRVGTMSLSGANDSGNSFSRIAELIEEHL